MGMMSPERLDTLHMAFHTAKITGLHNNITPAPGSFASELLGLIARKPRLESKYHSKKIKDSYSRALPTHIHTALQKWALVTQEKMASPLDFNSSYSHYWSAHSRDVLFGAHLNSLSSQFNGFSVCHPIYDDQTMNLTLEHAIYSAILSTEATATFMFLPSWNGSMITNPYSKLLTAYPHLCYNLGTIQAHKLTYATPQTWTSQEIPLPQAHWNLHIIAVWNTAARQHLNSHNPSWLQNLAQDIPEAEWHINSITNDPILNARHAGTASRFKKFEKLHSDVTQTANCYHRPALDEVPPLSHQSKLGLSLKIADWKSWTYTDGSCHVHEGKQVIGAGVYHPITNNSSLVEPNGAGITNTIGRAELAAIAAAVTNDHTHIATDSLTSLHQIRKQLLYPEKHCHHVQGDILKIISNSIRNSHSHIFLYKVKSHAGIAGNECADALAKYQACHGNSLPAETTIRTAGPGGNPFFDTTWLALEEVNQQRSSTAAPQHGNRLTYLPNLQAALKSHMHSNHRLGYANSKTGYYSYYQSLLPHVHKGISNAFWSMSNLSLKMKRNIFQYRTGTLFNQKHAVRFKNSTSLQCPLCQQADSALHILSGCQHNIISGMITERHNVACRLIMKAISKGSLAGCIIHMDAGSTDRLAQQNLQIPEHASNRTLPSWLFDARLSVRERLTSSRPDAILVTPLPTKPKPPDTSQLQQVRRTRQNAGARRAHELAANKREIHLLEIKYCEDTRPGNQLEASSKQHQTLLKRLKAKNVVLHTILLGVGGSIYTSHTLNHLKELGLDPQRAHTTALKLHAHSILYAHKLTTTRRALEKTSYSQGFGLEQGAASHPPDPH